MFEKFSGLSIQGKCFQNQTDFVFFKENNRCCLVYGKNGSGKSTISQAFNALKDNNQIFSNVKAIDKDGQDIAITEDEKNQIFVFNEEYINRKVQIKDNGLDTIVLLGDVVNLDKKLEKIERIYTLIKTRSNQYNKEFEKYQDNKNTDNPEKYKNEIEAILKDKFTDRWRKIENKQRITNNFNYFNTANEIFNNYNRKKFNYDELDKNFNNKLKDYEKIKNDLNFPNKIGQLNFNETKNLLSYKVKQTKLTSKDENIKRVISNQEITQNIMSSNKDICPYCFQKLADKYKKEILSSLENIFNPDIKNHQLALESKKVQASNLLLDLNVLTDIKELDENLFQAVDQQITEYEKIINQKIDEKIKNPFKPLNLDESLNNLITNINENLEKLEQKRQNFQKQKQRANELKKELEILNNKLAFCKIKDSFKYYKEKSQEKDNLEQKIRHNNMRFECIKAKQSELNSQREQISIAQDKINQNLKYIFFKEGRLELSEPNSQKQYALKSNGNMVKAKDISTGERNAIALSYFFTEIFSGENEKDFYKKPKFVVIDDPISSFDFENKVGIMSFLNYQIKQIMNNCDKSKIIVLTHDLMSAFDIQKIKINNKEKFIQKELKNQELIDFDKKYSEYKTLLSEIYEYATDPTKTNSTNIGNTMRKALEAFATFNYQCGIENITTDDDIVSKLQPEQKKYFQNLMYRLVLNSESHTENKIKTIDFFSYINESEKQRTAQDILSLICLLNEVHLIKYFKDARKINHIKDHWIIRCKL